MTVMIDMHEDYKARFEPFHTKRSSSEPAWLLDQRTQAMDRFAELGACPGGVNSLPRDARGEALRQ